MNKNQYGEDFVICTECAVNHIENCGDCFGFGFFNSGGPINAGYAHEFKDSGEVYKEEKFISCGECGSDIRGQNK